MYPYIKPHILQLAEVGTITNLCAQPYHDGIRISWLGHDFTDNPGITYHLQMTTSKSGDYVMLYRGSSTKYTWKADLDYSVRYMYVCYDLVQFSLSLSASLSLSLSLSLSVCLSLSLSPSLPIFPPPPHHPHLIL